jgi:predicted NBD/HSP70 family sugar kinase
VKLKALSESIYGAARGSKKAALISIDNGVGSALTINGEIFRGDNNRAGEIGHTTIDPYGILCDCGRRGCLQTYIAEGALIQEANKVKQVSSVREIIDAANNNEIWAVNILDRTTTYISIAINNVLCMYAPDTVILSGKLIDKYPELVNMIEEKCTQFIWEHFRGTFKLVYSKLKDDSVIIGAATLALNTYLNLEDY